MANIKEFPHDLLAEKTLIGCLLVDGQAIDEISNLTLKKADFYNPTYGIIFEAIQELSTHNKPIDYVTVCSILNEKGNLEEIGGQTAILKIAEDQSTTANIFHYAKIVRDKSSMRNVIRTSMHIADLGMSFQGNTEDFLSEVESKFFQLTNESKTTGLTQINSYLKQNLQELSDPARKAGEIGGLSSGYPELDKLILGMQAGQLIVLAARPAMGKTSLALNFAINACEQSGLPVAIFSLEMMAKELTMRLLTSKAKVDSKKVRQKDFLDTDLRNISMAMQKLSQLPILIDDNGSVTALDIMSQCRKIKADQGLGMIVIDYLQLMKGHAKSNNREQEISEISRTLKTMAKELACPVIALSQLNRGSESRTNKRPMVSDLRESGAIEQDADIVMMIYRDEVYNPDTKEPGIAEVIIGKNRAGETGTAKLAFVGKYTSFENLEFSRSGQN